MVKDRLETRKEEETRQKTWILIISSCSANLFGGWGWWQVTTPSTYVYQCFKEQYGTPFDVAMQAYVIECGLMQIFDTLKARCAPLC